MIFSPGPFLSLPMQSSSAASMDAVFEVLSKPSADRTDEDIGQWITHHSTPHHNYIEKSIIYLSFSSAIDLIAAYLSLLQLRVG